MVTPELNKDVQWPWHIKLKKDRMMAVMTRIQEKLKNGENPDFDVQKDNLSEMMKNFEIAVDHEAKQMGIGGELLVQVDSEAKSVLMGEEWLEEASKILLEADTLLEALPVPIQGPVQVSSTRKIPQIKFREFDEENPDLWFNQLELQFKAMDVGTEYTRFVSLQGLLNASQALIVESVTCGREGDEFPFTTAKKLLMDAFSLSTDQRLEKAFSVKWSEYEEKPSQYIGRFLMLFKDATNDEIAQWMLRRAMPSDIRLALSKEASTTTVKTLLKTADVLVQSRDKKVTTQSIVSAVKPASNQTQKSKFVLCSVHAKFGKKAWKCMGTPNEKCPMWDLVAQKSENGKDGQ